LQPGLVDEQNSTTVNPAEDEGGLNEIYLDSHEDPNSNPKPLAFPPPIRKRKSFFAFCTKLKHLICVKGQNLSDLDSKNQLTTHTTNYMDHALGS